MEDAYNLLMQKSKKNEELPPEANGDSEIWASYQPKNSIEKYDSLP